MECCGLLPPTCEAADNCGVSVPQFLATPYVFSLNFTNFTNPSGADLVYKPYLCTQTLVGGAALQGSLSGGSGSSAAEDLLVLPGGLNCVSDSEFSIEMDMVRAVVNFSGTVRVCVGREQGVHLSVGRLHLCAPVWWWQC